MSIDSTFAERQEVGDRIRADRGLAPTKARQLEIRASAIAGARQRLLLTGAEARRSLEAERALVLASIAVREGRTVSVAVGGTSTRDGAAPGMASVTKLPAGDGLTLEGYAAVFDSAYEVLSAREGHFRETIAKGAFAESLRSRTPVVMWEHGQSPTIGTMPIAKLERIEEDSRGLAVEARMYENWMTGPLRDAIDGGSVNGMSIRFECIEDEWRQPRKGLPERLVKRVSLHEMGPVVFPASSATSVGLRAERKRAAPDRRRSTKAERARKGRQIQTARLGVRRST